MKKNIILWLGCLLFAIFSNSAFSARCTAVTQDDCITDLSCKWKKGMAYGGTCVHRECSEYTEEECSADNTKSNSINTNGSLNMDAGVIGWKNCRFIKSTGKCALVKSCSEIDSKEHCTNLNRAGNCSWVEGKCAASQ